MAANWINVRYVGTTPISVNFKTWYPGEIHAIPEGQIEDFERIHGDVLVTLGENKGDVPGEGPADQQWPFGPMTDKPMDFVPTPGDPLTAVNVTLASDKPVPAAVEQAQEALANPQPARIVVPGATVTPEGVVLPAATPAAQEPVVTDEKRAERKANQEQAADDMAGKFVVRTTGEQPQGQPVESAVPAEDAPPVGGEPRTGHASEVAEVEGAEQAEQTKGKKGSK